METKRKADEKRGEELRGGRPAAPLSAVETGAGIGLTPVFESRNKNKQ